MELARRLFKGDRVIWIIFMILCLVSLVEVYSATSTLAYKSENYWEPIVRHAVLLAFGAICVLIFLNIPDKYYRWLGLALPLAILLLAVTPYIGVVINGEPRWISIFGITFQPSEVAKLCSVCFMAHILSKKDVIGDLKTLKIIVGFVGVTVLFIFVNNGSTAFLLYVIMLMMLYIGRISLKYILRLLAIPMLVGMVAAATLYIMSESAMNYMPDRAVTWKHRIERFFVDDRLDSSGKQMSLTNAQNKHYQEDLAKIAIATGGVLGKFPGHGQMRDSLPQAFSDFIYAIIIEEMGLVGGVCVLFLYIVLLLRVRVIAKRCDKLFPKYLILGCALMLVTQALINMAVAVGAFPVTGQPLPLISRGGTSNVISCLYIGIILSVSRFSANIGNEEDDYPEETSKAENDDVTSLPGVSKEEIDNWVPDSPSSKQTMPATPPQG